MTNLHVSDAVDLVDEMADALEACRTLIDDQFACAKSQALEGEHVSIEARDAWERVCATLAKYRAATAR